MSRLKPNLWLKLWKCRKKFLQTYNWKTSFNIKDSLSRTRNSTWLKIFQKLSEIQKCPTALWLSGQTPSWWHQCQLWAQSQVLSGVTHLTNSIKAATESHSIPTWLSKVSASIILKAWKLNRSQCWENFIIREENPLDLQQPITILKNSRTKKLAWRKERMLLSKRLLIWLATTLEINLITRNRVRLDKNKVSTEKIQFLS